MVTLNTVFKFLATREGGDGDVISIGGCEFAALTSDTKGQKDKLEIAFSRSRDWTLDLFKVGDPVEFHLGYTNPGCPQLTKLFEGKITKLNPGTPMVLHAIEGWQSAKGTLIQGSYTSQTFFQIVTDLVGRMGYEPVFQEGWVPPLNPPTELQVGGEQGLPAAEILDKLCEGCLATWYPIGDHKIYIGAEGVPREVGEDIPIFIAGINLWDEMSSYSLKNRKSYNKIVVTMYDSEQRDAAAQGVYQTEDYVDGDPVYTGTIASPNPTVASATAYAESMFRGKVKGMKGEICVIGDPRVTKGVGIKIGNSRMNKDLYLVTAERVYHYFGSKAFYGNYTTQIGFSGSFDQ